MTFGTYKLHKATSDMMINLSYHVGQRASEGVSDWEVCTSTSRKVSWLKRRQSAKAKHSHKQLVN